MHSASLGSVHREQEMEEISYNVEKAGLMAPSSESLVDFYNFGIFNVTAVKSDIFESVM